MTDRQLPLTAALVAFSLAALVVLFAAGCCDPNRPPTWACSLRERVVDCASRVASAKGAEVASKVLEAAISPNRDELWQALVDSSGDLAICSIAGLPRLALASRVSPAAAARLRAAGDAAAAFLKARGLRVR